MIDAHHHFWRYDPVQYPWIGPGMERLRRDFLPQDLADVASACGVEGVVSVQARQTVEETRWLLELAEHSLIRGVVGWAPLVDEDVGAVLESLAAHPKLRALRHVLQDEPDDLYVLREDFNRGVGLLKRFGLRYDILIFERHLPQAIRFVDRHPGQVFVLDHIAKPRIKLGEIEPWRRHMKELGRRANVYCKLSGMVTEADWRNWSVEQLRPYFETVLEAFGPARLMFGSDWPVCLAACEYDRWERTVKEWIAPLSAGERDRIERGTAIEAYGL